MTKKLLLLFAVLATAINALAYDYDFKVKGIYYKIISQQDLTCEVKRGEVKYSGDIVIPSTVIYKKNSFSVISIEKEAFDQCHSLTSVEIPNSVNEIGKWAFYKCSNLQSAEIPNSVTSIGNKAFYSCSSLASVEIPNSVTTIGEGAFEGCKSLTSVVIPNSVTTIGERAFWECSSLTSAVIGNSVTTIGDCAFKGCSSLTTVEIGNSVTTIGRNSFEGCKSLTSVVIPNSVTTIDYWAFSGCSNLTSVEMGYSVTSIGTDAFSGCSNLTSVAIPNSVTSIGSGAFCGCSSLTSVEMPNSVKTIGYRAFDCPKLDTVILIDGMPEENARKLYNWYSRVSFKKGDDSPKFDPKAFPVLEISEILFADNGNNKIDAFENCKVKLKVANTGKGAAVGCVAKAKISGAAGLTAKEVKLPTIAPGKAVEVAIELRADATLRDGMAQISVSVDEPNGFGCDPTLLSVETQAFVAPKVLIADYSITGAQGGTLEKRKPFDLQVLLQNAAQGVADDVDVVISVPQNVFITESNEQTRFARLSPGETKSMVYQLLVNNNYSAASIPVKFTLKEKHGKYAESRTINLSLNQSLAQNKIEIKGEAEKQRANIELAKIEGGVKQSDVDLSIPQNAADNKNTFAIVIANENYKRETAVRFAANDGTVLSQYLTKTLGVPAENIRVTLDATLNETRDQVDWLKSVAKAYKGEANVIFYYAGHGMPNEETGQAFLIPSDGNSSNPASCIALDKLYADLSALGVRRVCVFLDACFSGSQRGDGMLMAARGVAIKAKTGPLGGNMVVFSAAQGTETAYPYAEQGHGLFTYYLLKKLQQSRGNVTLGELGDYIADEVSRRSIVVNNKSQTPTTAVSSTIATDWKNWTLK